MKKLRKVLTNGVIKYYLCTRKEQARVAEPIKTTVREAVMTDNQLRLTKI